MPDINVSDESKVTESVVNSKPWFNGVHKFSSVKVNPPQEQPTSLKIDVNETIKVTDKLVGS